MIPQEIIDKLNLTILPQGWAQSFIHNTQIALIGDHKNLYLMDGDPDGIPFDGVYKNTYRMHSLLKKGLEDEFELFGNDIQITHEFIMMADDKAIDGLIQKMLTLKEKT